MTVARSRLVLAPAAAVLVGAVLGGCGHAARGLTEPPGDRAAATTVPSGSLAALPPVPLASPPSAPSGAPIGTSLRVTAAGATLTVSVTWIRDPLTGSGAVLPAGDRAVGVFLSVADDGPGTYDSAATADLSLLVPNGTAMPVLASAGPCATPRIDFEREIEPGERRTGCVAFVVPAVETPTTVRFDPGGVATGAVSWRVSEP